jgi:hypothetical protein
MASTPSFLVSVLAIGGLVAGLAAPTHADPVKCQRDVVKSMLKLKNTYLKKTAKCLDKQNVGKIPGPCPDAATALKIQKTRDKVIARIVKSCPDPDLTTLGFPSSCAFEAASTGIEAQCAALPVTSASEFAACLACWKEAELAEFMATLYASHAVEVCGGSLDETSPVCSDLDCTTPLPDQRNLGDTGENDCQKSIGKAGLKHLLLVEKALEKCGLRGGTRADCLADLKVQVSLDKARQKLEALIHKKCGNRDPVPSVRFCCRTGQGNMCTAVATRDECALLGGDVQDHKECGMDNTCDPVQGHQELTWWSSCPESDTCPGAPVTTLDELIECVDATAGEISAELLCIQFADGWGPCPADGSPSGAFVQ